MRSVQALAIAAAFLLPTTQVWAHGTHVHGESAEKAGAIRPGEDNLQAVNASYLKQVKAIFQRSCFDCHSGSTTYPWYANLPGVKHLISSDIERARTHLDLSDDFPFKGHGGPTEDLVAIKEALDGAMPPFRYRALHWVATLTEAQRTTVRTWVDESLALLRDARSSEPQ